MRLNYLKKFLFISVTLFLTIACTLSTHKTRFLGGVYFTDEGGYEIQKVTNYTFTEFSGGFEMVMPGSNQQVGPGFLVYGGLIDEERTNEELWNLITKEEYKFYQFEEPKNRKIDDIPGLIAVYQGVQENIKVKGKIFIAMVDKNQQFIMLGSAPEEEWNNFESIYEMVLRTVKFYIPNRSVKFENKYKRDINENEFGESPAHGISTEIAP